MKTINSILLISLITLTTGLVSCKKSQVGPAGPQGVSGEQGQKGEQGNANVKSSIFSTNNWKADSACKSYSYLYHTGDLTTSVLDNGAVMLYLGNTTGDNNNMWTPMPLSSGIFKFSFEIEMSTVRIFVTRSDGRMPENPGTQRFKLVLIPPAS